MKEEISAQRTDSRLWLLLSFLVPFFTFGLLFAVYGVYPFGTKQILVTDLWHQYYPFLCIFQEKLQSGGSLLYSWTSGLGSNFLAMLAYYIASPLNLLTVFVPASLLREALAVFVMCKVGFAGFFMALFLRHTFRRCDSSVFCFGILFALCGYMTGYYWNVIWLDTVALLPLVMLGIVLLVRDGNWRLYPVALAVALLSSYYIGWFLCIFAVLFFGASLLCFHPGWRNALVRTCGFAVTSLLGGGLSAWLLLPAYRALQLTYSASSTFPTKLTWYESWQEILSNVIGFHTPTTKEGLPNLYCGMLCVLLLFGFLIARRIPLREKLIAGFLLALLVVSCNLNVLNYIWHGFHFTNMLPYRFSFLFSFVLILLAYRAFLAVPQFRLWQFLAMLVGLVGFFIWIWNSQPRSATIWSLAFALVYFTLLLGIRYRWFGGVRLQTALLGIVCVELLLQTQLGVDSVAVTTRTYYPKNQAAVSAVSEQIERQDSSFYRMEVSPWFTLNDNALYDIHGVSQFSSTANVGVTTALRRLGLPASQNGNRYYYTATSPFTNLLLNVDYVLAQDGTLADDRLYTVAASAAAVVGYRSNYDLPLAFLVPETMGEYQLSGGNPFMVQNHLFTEMTGLTETLFTAAVPVDEAHSELNVKQNATGNYSIQSTRSNAGGTIRFDYQIPEGKALYAYVSATNLEQVQVLCNGMETASYEVKKQPYIFPIGAGTGTGTFSLTGTFTQYTSCVASIHVYELDLKLLEQGVEILSQGTAAGALTVTDTTVTATVTASEAQLLYTSIPYEVGWTATVDGVPVSTQAVLDAFVAVPICAGTHTIVLEYVPDGFRTGLAISLGSLLLLLGGFAGQAYQKRKKRERDNAKSQGYDVLPGDELSRVSETK